MPRFSLRRKVALFSLLSVPAMLVVTAGTSAVAAPSPHAAATRSAVTSSSLGAIRPAFAGSTANMLRGPIHVASLANQPPASATGGTAASPRRLPFFSRQHFAPGGRPTVKIPKVSCIPASRACDTVSTSSGGAVSVKGINAVDSASHHPTIGDIEPPDQGLCAGNGSVIETNNIGEMLIFNKALHRTSPIISLDKVMGLGPLHWSSGGDPTCLYDTSNGGHWFISELVSASPESKGGPFAGCFIAKANACLQGIAVSTGSSPFGPYNVYFLPANFNPKEPGAPYLLNDYAKISATRDAFLLFYDEFPLRGGGFGGGFFNGAQQFAFTKTALEKGLPPSKISVAYVNMGLLPTPNGTCARDNRYHQGGTACWFSVIPATPNPGQWDNSHGGSGFMLATLDFYSTGGNQLAVFDWTGLKNLNPGGNPAGIHFGGQLFNGVQPYYNNGSLPSGLAAAQQPGPIPLGDECGKAGLSAPGSGVKHCPEGGIATNSDQVTQAAQAQGQLWAGVNTAIVQTYSAGPSSQQRMGAAYWAVGTKSFDTTGRFSLTGQGYVTALGQDLEYPAIAAGSTGPAVMSFTLNGPNFYPSSAYGRLTATLGGLLGEKINIAALGQSPQDGFTEYQGYPGPTRPRWGDYGAATTMGGKVYFASEYIQYPNCQPPQFTLTIGTCGGTRDGYANWGTSVNYVTP